MRQLCQRAGLFVVLTGCQVLSGANDLEFVDAPGPTCDAPIACDVCGGGGCCVADCGARCECRDTCSCSFTCTAYPCEPTCSRAASCFADCAGGDCSCRDPGTSCAFVCTAPPCDGKCESGASCLLDCRDQVPGSEACQMSSCDGPVIVCPDNRTLACNAACPS